jgi:hypothetical protein
LMTGNNAAAVGQNIPEYPPLDRHLSHYHALVKHDGLSSLLWQWQIWRTWWSPTCSMVHSPLHPSVLPHYTWLVLQLLAAGMRWSMLWLKNNVIYLYETDYSLILGI